MHKNIEIMTKMTQKFSFFALAQPTFFIINTSLSLPYTP